MEFLRFCLNGILDDLAYRDQETRPKTGLVCKLVDLLSSAFVALTMMKIQKVYENKEEYL